MKFAEGMQDEDDRHVREGLAEDGLELYDTLRKDKLTKAEEQNVKLAAKRPITRLLDEHPKVLVQNWWKNGQTQRKVKARFSKCWMRIYRIPVIGFCLKMKSDNVFNLIVDFAAQGKKWARKGVASGCTRINYSLRLQYASEQGVLFFAC